MKRTNLYLFILVGIFVTSCNDWLEVESLSKDDMGYIFSSVEDAQSFINGVYQPFMEDGYTIDMSQYFNANTDIEMVTIGASTDGGRRDPASAEVQPGNSRVLQGWRNAWVAIDRSNLAIQGILGSPLYVERNPDMMQLLGEAYTLRAFWYHELVRNFGDVPFKTEPTKAGDDFYLPRTDRDEILSYIINDLIEIEPHMKWARNLGFGVEQMSREFTQAFIARLSLARGGYSLRKGLVWERNGDYLDYYEIANEYCKKVIASGTHSLNLSYGEVFWNQSRLLVISDDDIIFEIANSTTRGELGFTIGKRINAGSHAYGGGGGYYSYAPSYIYSFDPSDLRLFSYNERWPSVATFTRTGADLNPEVLNVHEAQVNKWSKYWLPTPMGPTSGKGTSINWPIMRYADVLLMFAETENELNGSPTSDAKEALSQVRRRAFDPSDWSVKVDEYVNSVSASKESFFNAIVDERAWELGGELMRQFDLVRWNLFEAKIIDAVETMIQMGKDVQSGTGDYANLPDRIYWRYDPVSGNIVYEGLFNRLETAPEGFTARNWLSTLWNPETEMPANFIQYNWRGIVNKSLGGVANYLMPIPEQEVSRSGGILTNEGYGW